MLGRVCCDLRELYNSIITVVVLHVVSNRSVWTDVTVVNGGIEHIFCLWVRETTQRKSLNWLVCVTMEYCKNQTESNKHIIIIIISMHEILSFFLCVAVVRIFHHAVRQAD